MIYLRVIRLIFGQNIQCHLKLFKPLLQRTREQRQPKSTLVKTIQQSLFHWGERIRPFSCCFLDISLVTLTILSPPYATTDIDEQYADIMLTRQVKEMLSHPFNLITNWRQTTHQTVNLKKQISKTWSQHKWFYWTKHPHYLWPYWYENSSTARTTFTRLCVEGTMTLKANDIMAKTYPHHFSIQVLGFLLKRVSEEIDLPSFSCHLSCYSFSS